MPRPVVKIRDPKPEQLLDLCLMGLAWLHEAHPEAADRLGNSVFTVMRGLGVISQDVQRGIPTNYGLITLAREHGQDVQGARRPSRQDIDTMAADSAKRFLYLRYPIKPMIYPDLFAPRGYPLVITSVGIDYAGTRMGDYAQTIVTKDEFLAAWGRHVRAMRGMHGSGGAEG